MNRYTGAIAGCVVAALASTAASAQTENAASPIRGFDWTYQGGEAPSNRHWASPDGVTWTETYPNGRSTIQKVETSARAHGCFGVITTKPEPSRAQTFIPDPGCPSMVLLFRVGAGDWRPLGVMRSISTEFVAPPPPAPVTDHPFLATTRAFCRTNHSRAADVLAAADLSGWSPIPAGGLPGAQARVKTIGGVRETLTVATLPMQLDGGAKAVVHICQVGSTAPVGDLAASVRAALGRGPTADSGHFAEWIFSERDGRSVFLPDDSTAAMSAALKTGPIEIVHLPSHGLFLMYNEVEAAP